MTGGFHLDLGSKQLTEDSEAIIKEETPQMAASTVVLTVVRHLSCLSYKTP